MPHWGRGERWGYGDMTDDDLFAALIDLTSPPTPSSVLGSMLNTQFYSVTTYLEDHFLLLFT